jgi:hypothetical protein
MKQYVMHKSNSNYCPKRTWELVKKYGTIILIKNLKP